MALFVGGVGVANIMVICVLERRREIGLRRALGATKRQIWSQFLGEAILLSLAGGVASIAFGAAVTVLYALSRAWIAVAPPLAWADGLGGRPRDRGGRRVPSRAARREPAAHRNYSAVG